MQKSLVVGIVLIVACIPFFILSETVLYGNQAYTNDEVNPVQNGTTGRTSWQSYPFGSMHYVQVKPYKLTMSPGDFIGVETVGSFAYAVYTVIGNETSQGVLYYSHEPYFEYENTGSSNIDVEIYVATNTDQTIITGVSLDHTERPNWIFISLGALLAILGIVLMLRSRRAS